MNSLPDPMGPNGPNGPNEAARSHPNLQIVAWVLVVGLCLFAGWLRLDVNAARDSVAHGDVGYYFSLARNLFEGRGFVLDYAPDHLSRPQALPTPANTYWMPLPAILAALGMAAEGEASYGAARAGFVLLGALTPLVGFLWGRFVLGSTLAGLFAAAMTAVSGVGLTQAMQPQTHGPILVFGSLALLSIVHWQATGRGLLAIGLLIGITRLNRSDGDLLFLAFACAWWLRRRDVAQRPGWRAWVVVLSTYLFAVSALWYVNILAFGSPVATGMGRVAWLRVYPELYSLPESLTAARYLEEGWEFALRSKVRALEKLAGPLVLGPASLQTRFVFAELSTQALAALVVIWSGALMLLRRRFAAVWLYMAVLIGLYGLVFSLTGPTSFRSVSLAFHPLLYAAGGLLVVRVARRSFGEPGGVVALLALAGLVVWFGTASVAEARKRTRQGAEFIQESTFLHTRILSSMVEPAGLVDEVLLVSPKFIHEFHADTRLRLVSLPYEQEPGIREVARRFGARYVLLIDEPDGEPRTNRKRPPRGAAAIQDHPNYRLIDQKRFLGRRVKLLEIGADRASTTLPPR